MKPKKLFHRNFSLMIIGQIISLFGNAILRFALSMYVLDLTGSAAAFGTILAVSMIPTVLLSPVGGIIADRINRRNIMVALDFTTAGLIAVFTLLFTVSDSLWIIGLLMVLLSVIQSFYQPSVQASIPALTADENLMKANSVVIQVNALANLVGPVLGGFLYGFFGLMPILIASGLCFFTSAVMEIFLHIPFIRQQKNGGLLAGVFAKKVPFNRSYRFLLTAVLLVLPAAASVVSNAHPMVSYGVLLASVLGCMAGATLFNISAQTFIQQQTPDHLIGKVMSFVSVIAVCTLPIGQAMYGFLFEAFKERIFLVVLFAAVMGLVIALAVRHILRRVPSPQAMD